MVKIVMRVMCAASVLPTALYWTLQSAGLLATLHGAR
jgi:hypothetical protein